MAETLVTRSVIIESRPAVGRDDLLRRRLFIFPTRQGLIFASMIAVMLMGAINYSNNMAYMLTFLLASLYMVCMLHTYRNLRGLILTGADAAPVHAGQMAQFPIVLDNREGMARYGLRLRCAGRRHKTAVGEVLSIRQLDQGALHRDSMPVSAGSRGILVPGRLILESVYPLGLFRAWSYPECRARCIVYPRPEGDPALPSPLPDNARDRQGELAGTDDFTGFRHYRPGDSIRHIDWKALAREQDVLIKKFSGSGARSLLLHWDHTASLRDPEARLSQLALWILEADRSGLRYGLILPDGETRPDTGESHRHRCLTRLALYGLDEQDDHAPYQS